MKMTLPNGTILEGTPSEMREYENYSPPFRPEIIQDDLPEEEDPEDWWTALIGSHGGRIFNLEGEPHYLRKNELGDYYWEDLTGCTPGYYDRVLSDLKTEEIPEYTWKEAYHLLEDFREFY
jgi:hypothetical protein